jgi:hypothetical protein
VVVMDTGLIVIVLGIIRLLEEVEDDDNEKAG